MVEWEPSWIKESNLVSKFPKPTISVSSDDEAPPLLSGSSLSAKIRTAKRNAVNRDALKPINRSKYGIGAPTKLEARTFTIFLSQGDTIPLQPLPEGQK